MVINEDSGYLYIVGGTTCNYGLHMVDISSPKSPQFAGCYSADAYVHDAQCVNYNGPTASYVGKELCFCSNEDTLTIVDVSNKAAPTLVARKTYGGVAYAHQGWLTEDHKWFLMVSGRVVGVEEEGGWGRRAARRHCRHLPRAARASPALPRLS